MKQNKQKQINEDRMSDMQKKTDKRRQKMKTDKKRTENEDIYNVIQTRTDLNTVYTNENKQIKTDTLRSIHLTTDKSKQTHKERQTKIYRFGDRQMKTDKRRQTHEDL